MNNNDSYLIILSVPAVIIAGLAASFTYRKFYSGSKKITQLEQEITNVKNKFTIQNQQLVIEFQNYKEATNQQLLNIKTSHDNEIDYLKEQFKERKKLFKEQINYIHHTLLTLSINHLDTQAELIKASEPIPSIMKYETLMTTRRECEKYNLIDSIKTIDGALLILKQNVKNFDHFNHMEIPLSLNTHENREEEYDEVNMLGSSISLIDYES